MRPRALRRAKPLLGALMALAAGWLHAQEEAVMPAVKTTAKRQLDPDELDANKTTRLTAQDITQQQAKTIKDLVRYEPGVSVTNKASRFGLSGFNIRGLEDNRIHMQVDGARIADSFVFGGYSSASRNMVDIELLEAVEIKRGTGAPDSASDALGGVVSFTTPRPEDVLRGQRLAGTLKSLHQTVDHSTAWVATAAAGAERFKLLVRAVSRRGQAQQTLGDVGGIGIRRTQANPQQQQGQAALVKLAFTPSAHYRAELGYQSSDRDVHTHVLSGVVGGLAVDMNAQDRYRHSLWLLDQRLDKTALGTVALKVFHQTSSTRQYTRQDRKPTASAFSDLLYQRYFEFDQTATGLKLDLAQTLAGAHLLSWGGDASSTLTLQGRDGYTTLKNGTVNRAVTVDTFPTRDTPPSRTRRLGLYLQDDWLATDSLTLTGALRWERYRLTPKPDAIYLANEAAAPATEARFNKALPTLGALWRVGGGHALALRLAQGFRAPPYDDVNIGFANLAAGYTAVANPALKAETSRGAELSWRHADAAGTWSITAFDNRYRDFIERVQLDCPTDPACSPLVPLTFQSQNLAQVRIHGLEARFSRELAPGWLLRGAAAYTKGRNRLTGQPLYSINPASGSLGLTHTRGAFRYEVFSSFAQAKRTQDAEGSGRQFLPAGYGVVDLRLTWAFAKGSQVTLGANNLFNRLVYHWADVPVADIHIPDSQAGPLRYSQPGRHYALTLLAAF